MVEPASASERSAANQEAKPPVVPWMISAKSAAALGKQSASLGEFVSARSELDNTDIGWSLASRSTFEHRAVVLGADREQLLGGLAELADGLPGASVVQGRAAPAGKTVFVFPGQGSQWVGMGIELLDTAPVSLSRSAHVRRRSRSSSTGRC
jgi:polyketide synthase 12